METPLVLNACGKLDAVFGSEPDYGDYFKRAYPGAEYVQIDVERKSVPISATMIRNMKNSKEVEKWVFEVHAFEDDVEE
jgi:HTH-type transcriptional repressor of NAD biosynthesis genes